MRRSPHEHGNICLVINSSVHLTIPASGEFSVVLKAALGTLCERMRWPASDSDELSYVALDAFGSIVQDPKCDEVEVSLRIDEATLQVQLACDGDLSTRLIDAVQDAAAGRVDRTEIDGSNRSITLTKTPTL